MANGREITVRCFISIGGAAAVPLDTLTPEEAAKAGDVMLARFAGGLQDYYSQHPGEYEALPEIIGA